MRFNIICIWLMWLLAMGVLAGIMWVLFMFPLPGGSSGLPTREEVLQLFAHLGVTGTITIFAVVFLPPVLLTYFEIWKARRSGGPSPATEGARNGQGEQTMVNALLRRLFAGRAATHITVTIDPDRFRFEGPGAPEGNALEAATALRVGHDLRVGAIGDEALAPAATGVLIRPFEAPPRRDTPWLHEAPLIQYCRYYLRLAAARTGGSLHLVGPVVTVYKAHTLRGFFRGQETEILDRVFRAAGASVVTFA